MLSLAALWRAFVCGGILPSESEFSFFLPVVVGLLRLRTETLASICSGVYWRLARYGFFPSRNGCSGHPVAVHIFTSFGLPQQQSKHLSRITFTGFVTYFSIGNLLFSVIAVSPCCHRCPCVCRNVGLHRAVPELVPNLYGYILIYRVQYIKMGYCTNISYPICSFSILYPIFFCGIL